MKYVSFKINHIELRIVLICDLFQSVKKCVWSQNKKVMAISKCILAESEQNKLKTEDVSTIFIKDSKNLGLCTKYTQYQKLPEAISNDSVEAVTASLVLLLHRSNCFSHIYNSNSKNIRYLQPSLFHSLLWTSTALLIGGQDFLFFPKYSEQFSILQDIFELKERCWSLWWVS